VDDAREVSRCVAALEAGLKPLRGGLPLCTRLLCELHQVLLTHPGGPDKTPGEVRRTQGWIGGTRPGNAVFVPPPAAAVPECLAALERFLNDEPEPVPPLIKAALVPPLRLRWPRPRGSRRPRSTSRWRTPSASASWV